MPVFDIEPGSRPESPGVLRFYEQGKGEDSGVVMKSDGTSTAPIARLTSTSDMTLTSTNHALQIGPDSATNLRMDNNEIQAVYNGTQNALYINPEGGDVGFFTSRAAGSTADTLTVRGNVTVDGSVTSVGGLRVNSSDVNVNPIITDSPSGLLARIMVLRVGGTDRLSLNADGNLSLANGIGTYGAVGPTTRPTVSGSRADGTALASLLTALASFGLITDSTTA